MYVVPVNLGQFQARSPVQRVLGDVGLAHDGGEKVGLDVTTFTGP